MTVSHWRRAARPEVVETEVVVIGGGVCGLSAGLELAARRTPFVVLERERVGSGASTRNAGFLMRGAADNYAAAVRQYGRDLARTLWTWTEENLRLLREDGVEGLKTYAPRPSCLLALHEHEFEEIRASEGQLREDGFAVEWMERGDDTVWNTGRPRAGLINPGDAVVNPFELVKHLAGRPGERVREHQEVSCIEEERGGVVVRTADTEYRARRAMVCTNAYTRLLLPRFATLVEPRRGQMLALHAPDVRLDCAYYANHGSEYFRHAGEEIVVVGGCRTYFADVEVGYEDLTTDDVQQALERFARDMLGASYPVVARWSGVMGFSPDGLPLMGPAPGLAGVYFCGGFTGHGMSMARRCAKAAVAEMLEGQPTPFPLSRVLGRAN